MTSGNPSAPRVSARTDLAVPHTTASTGWLRTLWERNPERVAWVILFLAFGVFLVLAVSVPLAVRYTVRYATVAQTAQFNPTLGTVLLYPPKPKDVEPIAITESRLDIPEGSRLVTVGEGTQGVLGLMLSANPDEPAVGTVHLYPGTSLELVRLRRPRFDASPEPYRVWLRLHEGRVRLFTNSTDGRPLAVTVETPHGKVVLDQGAYTLSVTPEQTDVAVRLGTAQVTHRTGASLTVSPGLRTWMGPETPPSALVSAERNLIRNGDFSQPLLDTWETYTDAPYVTPGAVEVVELAGRRVARFVRDGEDGVHTEVGIRQAIEQDVNGYDSLIVRLDVQLLRQTLRGAGEKSSEFPLRFEIQYTDIYGKELRWGWGFYFRDPPPEWPLFGGEKIAARVWYSYESPNLMELLVDTRPAYVQGIRVYASGWNYESLLGEISLIVE